MRVSPLVVLAALSVGGSLIACNGGKSAEPETTAETAPGDADAMAALNDSVSSAMDTTADPCVDFYQYACGGWLESNELPDDKTRLTRSFTTIYDDNQELLKGILEEAAKNPGDDPDQQKVGAFYEACMDTEAIDARGLEPIQPLLADVDAAKDLAGTWVLAGKLHTMGVDPFYGAGVEPDYKDPTFNRLGISQGGLALPDRSFYLNEDSAELKDKYQAFAADMLARGTGADAESAEARAKAVVAFETKLAEMHWERAELRDAEKTYHPKTLEELDAMTPNLSWKAHFDAIGYGDMDTFNVGTPDVIEGMDKLLAETDLQVVKDYLRLHVILTAAPYLSSEIDEAQFAFFGTVLNGQKVQRPRWKRCVSRTESALGEVLGRVYVDKAFPGDSKQIAVDMIQGIENEFEKGMGDLDWMDDPTREVAVEKSQAIANKIGYPDEWRDYSDLTISAEEGHFDHVLAGRAFGTSFWLDQVGEEVDEGLWYMTPQMVNAYYNPLANEIAFPAGILQPPFFSRNYPKAMNYGGIGMVMAHEVSHGFDDSGRKFSPTGELTEWWAPEVVDRFEERAQCIVDQYNGYEVLPDLYVNGKLTLGENIADLGGLKQSHRAYMAWREANGPEPEVAGLDNEQLFFVAFAQGWCTLSTPEATKVRVRSDSHSPPQFRVNGPVRNLPAFGEAFDCEAGAPLYPKEDEVCVVW